MPNWIELEGLVNLRDVGGMPTTDGGSIAAGRLLRSDNLQDLTPADIAELRRRGLTDVVDLRSDVESMSEGPGPITREDGVTVHHHSLFTDTGRADSDGVDPNGADTAASSVDTATAPAAALPWVGRKPSAVHDIPDTSYYLSYLVDRPDSVLAALRVIADADGATLVHCAAGKDRTGTVVALALLVAGADPTAVIADYAASSERIERVVQRLMATRTYADNLRNRPLDSHRSRPETMQGVIEHLDTEHGGVEKLLATIGWTPADTVRLRAKLRA
jgi:protein-tyrosine phosphatase